MNGQTWVKKIKHIIIWNEGYRVCHKHGYCCHTSVLYFCSFSFIRVFFSSAQVAGSNWFGFLSLSKERWPFHMNEHPHGMINQKGQNLVKARPSGNENARSETSNFFLIDEIIKLKQTDNTTSDSMGLLVNTVCGESCW